MNKQHPISEKEFELINILATGMAVNQRELAQNTGISLGMVNLLLKRLVTKGYLRVRQLNRRKVDHLLTAKGISEKAKKSYHYTLKTLSSLTHIKGRIQDLVLDLYKEGAREFILVGQDDLSDLAEMAIRQLPLTDVLISRIPLRGSRSEHRVILWTDRQDPEPLYKDFRLVNVLSSISQIAPAPSRSTRTRASVDTLAIGGSRS